MKRQKIGYQGLIYRQAVSNIDQYINNIEDETIVFAGFNALNAAEERIVQKLIDLNKAEIFWDIDQIFIENKHHDAGLFIRRFKNSWKHYNKNQFNWIVNDFSQIKRINIVGTSKSIGQAKIVSEIISNLKKENPTINLKNVALVLGDENLLIPILHSLPADVGTLNITMGYSSKNNPIQQLVSKLMKMHEAAINRSNKSYVFYYKDILDIIRNPNIEPYLNEKQLITTIKQNNFTFISHQKLFELQADKSILFDLLFSKWENNNDVLEKITAILLLIKENLTDTNDDKVTKTFLFAIFQTINRLHSYCTKNSFITSIKTLYEIYKQLIDVSEVSFEGEPLSGLQIMGVLESRVLDFDTVIITSMNEGKFPAGKTNNSFIPYDIKRELGLPTFKEKDAIYTYHFYHLLQRAERIYLIYNTENDGLDGGEKSRFITQLEVEKQQNHIITHEIIQPSVPTIASEKIEIQKTDNIIEKLSIITTEKGLSPSALTSYIRNPLQFYYQKILSIKESEDVEENIALNTLGTIIHKTLEELYKPYINICLSVEIIDNITKLADNEVLKQFKAIYKEGEIKKGKNLLAFEVAKRNIYNFLKLEKENITKGDIVKIVALETTLEIVLNDSRLQFPVKIAGNVDRIEIRNDKYRIIDYKTGKVEKSNLILKDWNGLTLDQKNDKIIQVLCYAIMFADKTDRYEMEAGIISFKNLKNGFLPFTFIRDKTQTTTITTEIIENFKTEIILLINEILDKKIPFTEKL